MKKLGRYSLAVFCLFFVFLAFVQAQTPHALRSKPAIIAILGIPEETEALASQLENKREVKVAGVSFNTGSLKGRRVVLARVGFGKVNAALAATLLIQHFNPEVLIFTGSAGALSPELIQGDVIVGVNTTQHDFGQLTPKGFVHWRTRDPISNAKNPEFFTVDSRLRTAAANAKELVKDKLQKIDLAEGVRRPEIREGVIITGDVFVSDPKISQTLRQSFSADAVEMEGAAVSQICWELKVPCLIIRSISDRADGSAYLDYYKFVKVAAGNSALLVAEIVAQLGSLPPVVPAPSSSPQLWKSAFELAFGDYSPYSGKFPDLYKLPYETNAAISKEVLDQIVRIAVSETGISQIGLVYGPGAYKDNPVVPSAQLESKATDSRTRTALNVIGYLAQQTLVISSKQSPTGNRPALQIVETTGKDLAEPQRVELFWRRLTTQAPKLNPGFSAVVGNAPGLYIIDSDGDWLFSDFATLKDAIKTVSTELNISTTTESMPVEYIEIGNDWQLYPSGEQYLLRLPPGLRRKVVDAYQPMVEEMIRKAFAKYAPGSLQEADTKQPKPAFRVRLNNVGAILNSEKTKPRVLLAP